MPAVKPSFCRLNRNHPLSQGLAIALPCHEGSGPTLSDVSGNLFTGTSGGAGATWAGGQSGWGLKYDGTSTAYHSLGTTAGNPGAGDLSLATWIKVANGYVPAGGAGILGKSHAGGGASRYSITFSALGNIQGQWGPTFSTIGLTGASDGNWHHIVLVISRTIASPSMTIYRDFNAESVTTSITAATGTTTSPDIFLVGAYGNGSNNGPSVELTGSVDTPLVWLRALNEAERSNLYYDHWQMFRQDSSIPYVQSSLICPHYFNRRAA